MLKVVFKEAKLVKLKPEKLSFKMFTIILIRFGVWRLGCNLVTNNAEFSNIIKRYRHRRQMRGH